VLAPSSHIEGGFAQARLTTAPASERARRRWRGRARKGRGAVVSLAAGFCPLAARSERPNLKGRWRRSSSGAIRLPEDQALLAHLDRETGTAQGSLASTSTFPPGRGRSQDRPGPRRAGRSLSLSASAAKRRNQAGLLRKSYRSIAQALAAHELAHGSPQRPVASLV
jgi:hypothetical protein